MSRSEGLGDGELATLGVGWLVAVAGAGVGVISLSLVDQVVLFAVAVVLPLALGGRAWWWAVAAGAALIGFLVPVGPAGLLACPFLVVTLIRLAESLSTTGAARPALGGRSGRVFTWRLAVGAEVLATAYAAVAATFLVLSRFGVEPLGLREPIVELTAVHYSFAGAAALVLAAHALDHAGRGWRGAAVVAVALTATAPPVVAVGFATKAALPQVGGAVMMTLGVWLTATLQLRRAVTSRGTPALAGLLTISGLAVWAPMVLAVAWAAGQYWAVPMLSIPDMARTHGVANAFAFALCGLLARRLGPAEVERVPPVGAAPSSVSCSDPDRREVLGAARERRRAGRTGVATPPQADRT